MITSDQMKSTCYIVITIDISLFIIDYGDEVGTRWRHLLISEGLDSGAQRRSLRWDGSTPVEAITWIDISFAALSAGRLGAGA